MEDIMLDGLSKEIAIAKECMDFALWNGASKVRITLTRSVMDLVGILNGEVDKVSHALDRSLQIALFVDGRFGSFSSNRLEMEELKAFILNAIGTVRMLEPDQYRQLPGRDRIVKNATEGNETGLLDTATASDRREMALKLSLWNEKESLENGFTILGEEGEYSETLSDMVVMDSEGLIARHTETSFEIGNEYTIATPDGKLYSGYWWDASAFYRDIEESVKTCARKALERTVSQIGPGDAPGGKYNVVIDSECASKLLNPVLSALGGFAVQQKNSFLADDLGAKVFPDNMTVWDMPLTPGKTGSRLFDSEGVATREMPIIDHGVVKTFFLNTYIAGKMGMEPTVEDSTRVVVRPGGKCRDAEALMASAGDGILVTGFNGGNSNSATGDFSYGIEGFLFRGGKKICPIKEMLMTGNFKSLWNSLVDIADDARPCLTKQIPSLWFKDVDISA